MGDSSTGSGLEGLQKRLQHTFKQRCLLQRALTHRSFSADHYERLEFLGDSVLGLAVSSLLYRRLSELAEGDLSRVRAHMVRQDTLCRLALNLRLNESLRLGEGELKSGGNHRPSILADVLEAVIGAIYLDADFVAAEAFVHRLFNDLEFKPQMEAVDKDAKTALQEWLQARKMKPPSYRIVATSGAAHLQTFDVECEVPSLGRSERGAGPSKRIGEQAAARAMLAHLQAKKP